MQLIVGRVREHIYGTAAPYAGGSIVYVPRTDPEVGWEREVVSGIRRDQVLVAGRWWPVSEVRRANPDGEAMR